jgi:hypothetical protein
MANKEKEIFSRNVPSGGLGSFPGAWKFFMKVKKLFCSTNLQCCGSGYFVFWPPGSAFGLVSHKNDLAPDSSIIMQKMKEILDFYRYCFVNSLWFFTIVPDPYVSRPPGSASGSLRQRYLRIRSVPKCQGSTTLQKCNFFKWIFVLL